LFYVTPYYEVVDAGANYLLSHKSFLRLEQRCEEHLLGLLKTTIQITTGPQPIIAYLLMKENEIRMVRLILTAKKNFLDTQLILDRISWSVKRNLNKFEIRSTKYETNANEQNTKFKTIWFRRQHAHICKKGQGLCKKNYPKLQPMLKMASSLSKIAVLLVLTISELMRR